MAEFPSSSILALASGIHSELNDISTLSIGYISGVLTSNAFLNTVNGRLSTAFTLSGTGPSIVGSDAYGGFSGAAAVASLQFQLDYSKRQAMSALQGLGGLGFVTTLKDGDSSISRESPVKAASEWRNLRKELEQTLQVAVANWKRTHTLSVSVDSATMASWPTP